MMIVILSDHGYSTVNAFRYGIDPIPEWFDKISQRTKELDVMVDGHKVKALDIILENGILRAFYGYYRIMDSYDVYNSISVDDVRDMVKDITEDKLIIQYCS